MHNPFLAVPVGPVSLFDTHERIIFKFLDSNILQLLRIGIILTGIHEAGYIRSLSILDDDMVLRRRSDIVLDFFIDNRIVSIVSLGHDVFIESRRPDGNEESRHENRHGQADEILTASPHDD